MIGDGYELKHPIQIAIELTSSTYGNVKWADGPEEIVKRAYKKIHFAMVPVPKADGRAHASALFDVPRSAHAQCLRDMIALAEIGPTAADAVSRAWAARRVKEVISSPATRVWTDCWPYTVQTPVKARLYGTLRSYLQTRGTSIAVVDLPALAGQNGILDRLKSEGFNVQGPAWH